MTETNRPALISDGQAATIAGRHYIGYQPHDARECSMHCSICAAAFAANGDITALLADRAARVERIRQLESFAPADFEAIKLAIGSLANHGVYESADVVRALALERDRLREAAEIGLTLAEMWIHDHTLDEHPSPKKAAERMALLLVVPNWREKEGG